MGRTRPVPERRADAHRDVTAVRPRGASLRPLGARLRFFLDHSMTCDDAGFRGCTDGWPGVVAGRCSGLRARAATRPGSPLYLRNYMSVIRPRLWRTLWITFVPGVDGRRVPAAVRHDAPDVHSAGRGAVPIRAERLTQAAAGPLPVPAQCSAPPARAASCSVRSATSTIRARARAPVGASTTSADGTWTKPPRIPASAVSVASRCWSA